MTLHSSRIASIELSARASAAMPVACRPRRLLQLTVARLAFLPLVTRCGLVGAFIVLGAFSLLSAALFHALLPETAALDLDDLEDAWRKPWRPALRQHLSGITPLALLGTHAAGTAII